MRPILLASLWLSYNLLVSSTPLTAQERPEQDYFRSIMETQRMTADLWSAADKLVSDVWGHAWQSSQEIWGGVQKKMDEVWKKAWQEVDRQRGQTPNETEIWSKAQHDVREVQLEAVRQVQKIHEKATKRVQEIHIVTQRLVQQVQTGRAKDVGREIIDQFSGELLTIAELIVETIKTRGQTARQQIQLIDEAVGLMEDGFTAKEAVDTVLSLRYVQGLSKTALCGMLFDRAREKRVPLKGYQLECY